MVRRTGHANRHADLSSRQWPELVGRLCACSCIVVNHQRINNTSSFPSLLSRHSSQSPLRRASTSCGTRHRSRPHCRITRARSALCSTASSPLTCGLADHPRLPALCDAMVCNREGAVVRHRGRGVPPAGLYGRGARAGGVDHSSTPVARAGARRDAVEHPPRCDGCTGAQGVRADCRCYHGCCCDGTHEAQMNAPAAPTQSSPHLMFAISILLQSISHALSTFG